MTAVTNFWAYLLSEDLQDIKEGNRDETCLTPQVIHKLLKGNPSVTRPMGFGVQPYQKRHYMLKPITQYTLNVASM